MTRERILMENLKNELITVTNVQFKLMSKQYSLSDERTFLGNVMDVNEQ